MTREKFWEIVTTKLVWVDYWNGESEPSDEVKEILTNSLLIPKPRFQLGDKVRMIEYPKITYTIFHSFYQRSSNRWYYTFIENNCGTPEDKIELVEAAE